MKRGVLTIVALAMTLPMAAQARSPERPELRKSHPTEVTTCAPGLAKKSPACVPPGHAKLPERKLTRDYVLVQKPERYGLDPRYSYYRYDGQVYRVDRETREILDLIGAVTAILR